MSKPWTIYGLYSPVSRVVRYIGMTTRPKRRLADHLSAARRGSELPVHRWIRSMLALGVRPVFTVLEQGCDEDWQGVEQYWIFKLQTGRLLNVTAGGHAVHVPPASRKMAGEKLKTRVFTEEHRARISEAKRGSKRPDTALRNRAQAGVPRGPMKLSEGERERRRGAAKVLVTNLQRYFAELTPEQKRKRSDAAREQMKRVWAERRAKNGG